jgi:aspartate racemase
MKPKCIGIIGGAGPQAGVYLLERLFTLATELYNCSRDADFPKVILISFPFSEMLGPESNDRQISQELSQSLAQLRSNGASVLAIACNTLHAFLEEEPSDLINLPRMLCTLTTEPLILCTSTSARFGLHKRYLPCRYPAPPTQSKVDYLIDHVLAGQSKEKISSDLTTLINEQKEQTVVLGCTELSLLSPRLSPTKKIIDPLELLAQKLITTSFHPPP